MEEKKGWGARMKTKMFKKGGLTIKYTKDDMAYGEAVRSAPKGWRMIKSSEAMKIMEEYKAAFPFWFWCKNPEWNEGEWRPVGRGGGNWFDLYGGILRASRGVYVKDEGDE